MSPESPPVCCRTCGQANLQPFLDLGHTPLADALVPAEQADETDPTYPLEVAFCPACSLVQLLETVAPEVLFQRDYPYYSSFSPALLEHAKHSVEKILKRCDLGADSLVIELASNDGYLLKNYLEAGIPVLGIDPAEGPARAAEKLGVPTLVEFFDSHLGLKLAAEDRRAEVIHGNNVLAHVADPNGFVSGIDDILRADGVAVFEAPYVGDLIEKAEFDTIYHEHLCYFSATALGHLFERHGLFFNDVERIPIHGGSLRMFVEKRWDPQPALIELQEQEQERGLTAFPHYEGFGERVRGIQQELLKTLGELKAEGKSIAAYGAAAKGSTLLNTCGIGRDLVDFVVDRNVHKQGKLMPGVHIPIHSPEELLERQPDVTLLLAWNFAEEILEQQAEYRQRGGKFLVPIPSPELV